MSVTTGEGCRSLAINTPTAFVITSAKVFGAVCLLVCLSASRFMQKLLVFHGRCSMGHGISHYIFGVDPTHGVAQPITVSLAFGIGGGPRSLNALLVSLLFFLFVTISYWSGLSLLHLIYDDDAYKVLIGSRKFEQVPEK